MTQQWNILLVEDDENLSYLLKEHLSESGFIPTVCHFGKKALIKVKSEKVDLCILDIVLPDIDGISLAKEIRKINSDVPIVFLTSRNLKSDQMIAYNSGADDYLTKPFDADVLVLKINAILNRVYGKAEEIPKVIPIGNYNLDVLSRRLISDNQEVRLSKTECGILEQLFRAHGKPVSRDDIMKEVWGKSDFFVSKSLDVYINRIRKILAEHTNLKLETIRSVGYMLVLLKETEKMTS